MQLKNKYTIGMLDSGIGGLTILKEVKKLLPYTSILYYQDDLHNPYGEKTDSELIAIVDSVVQKLMSTGVKEIVLACNTASTRCIRYLKSTYPDIVFISTVPAIKVAADRGFKHTLVLATPLTIESNRVQELVDSFKREDQTYYLEGCPGLAHAIETRDFVTINQILSEIQKEYASKEIDSIVLGCTHYPFIGKLIQQYFPNSVLLDSSEGVAKETKRQYELHEFGDTFSKVDVYSSLKNEVKPYAYPEEFDQLEKN